MGFSLKRALAGAVVGGAHAAGEVFDAQLKEAAADRQRIAEEERARRQAEYADELLAKREASKQALIDRREADKRKIYKDTVAEATAKLKENNIKIGSAEGQQSIAEAFINAGYPEFGDKFSDNAQKAREADDRKELKKIEMANLMETKRISRAAAAEARNGRIDLKRSEDFKMADKAYNDMLTDYEIPVFNDDGKRGGTDPTIKNWIRGQTFEIARKDPYSAMQAAQQLGATVDELRSANPGVSLFKITQMAEDRVKAGTKAVNAATTGQTIDFNSPRGALPPATSQGSQPKVRVPGIVDRFGQVNDGDYDQAAGA